MRGSPAATPWVKPATVRASLPNRNHPQLRAPHANEEFLDGSSVSVEHILDTLRYSIPDIRIGSQNCPGSVHTSIRHKSSCRTTLTETGRRCKLQSVIVQYALSLDEYLESQHAFRMRMANDRLLFRNLYGLACLATLLGINSRLSGSTLLGHVLFIVAAGLLLERAILWRLRAGARYRNISALREPIGLRIEESNLIRTSSTGTEEIRWANILACHETCKVFLLRLGPEQLLTVPKRAFSPGDLFHFKELRHKELIVRTTCQNSDIILLKFAVSWALIALAVISLFIGYVHNFLTQIPGARRTAISSGANIPMAEKSPPATREELLGRGMMYLVPLGNVRNVSIPTLIEDFRKRYGLELRQLPSISPPSWAWNPARHQHAAEDLITAMKLAYPKLAVDPRATPS